MQKFPKSRAEIERLVLQELQSCKNCQGAVGISVIDWISPGNEANWTVEAYKPGTSGKHECEMALEYSASTSRLL
jgi:hypothetical protein